MISQLSKCLRNYLLYISSPIKKALFSVLALGIGDIGSYPLGDIFKKVANGRRHFLLMAGIL